MIQAPVQPFSLDVLKDGVLLETIELSQNAKRTNWILGRDEDAVDIVLAHASCSRKHARLDYRADGTLTVTDLSSAQGTILNKIRIKSGDPVRCRPGDHIKFGASTRSYVVNGPADQLPEEMDNEVISNYRSKRAAESLARQRVLQQQQDATGEWQLPATQRQAKDEKLWLQLESRRAKAERIDADLSRLRAKETNADLSEAQQATLVRLETALEQLHVQFLRTRYEIEGRTTNPPETSHREEKCSKYHYDGDVIDTTAVTADASTNWRMRKRNSKIFATGAELHEGDGAGHSELCQSRLLLEEKQKVFEQELALLKSKIVDMETELIAVNDDGDHDSAVKGIVLQESIKESAVDAVQLESQIRGNREKLEKIESLIILTRPDDILQSQLPQDTNGRGKAQRALELERQRKLEKPVISTSEAIKAAEDLFGLSVQHESVKEMDSYDDRNFYFRAECTTGLVTPADSNIVENVDPPTMHHFVLKVHNGVESANPEFLHCQNEAMARMRAAHPAGAEMTWTPRALPGIQSSLVSFLDCSLASGEKRSLAVRLLPFKPGNLLGNVIPDVALLVELGALVGHTVHALHGFAPQAAHRPVFLWDLRQALAIRPLIKELPPKRRDVVESVLNEYEERVLSRDSQLRKCCIHGDINDQNVLVRQKDAKDGNLHSVAGLLDFGDMIYSWQVGEIAIAIAYAIIARHYPHVLHQKGGTYMSELDVAVAVLNGYMRKTENTHFELNAVEWDVLPVLIAVRIAVSLTLGTYSSAQDKDNEYLQLTLEPGWNALRAWRDNISQDCTKHLRKYCKATLVSSPAPPVNTAIFAPVSSPAPPENTAIFAPASKSAMHHPCQESATKRRKVNESPDDSISMWIKPKHQTGDGKTALNSKFGY